ncbi:MAG: T9SS type A sorting domain-containing protein [Bacteroidia bacterium]|nr:T9SS type A sorting domain-containing protein [Bacteroidia bacterium]
MKTSIAIICLFFSLTSTAQIIFTRADFGSNGDKILYAVDSPVYSTLNFGSTGPNYSWNFGSKLYPQKYDSTIFLSATADPNAPGVTTNLLLRSVANGDQYAELTSSFVKTIIDLPAYHAVGIKLKLFNFPLTYQSVTADSTTAIARGTLAQFGITPITGIDSIRINAKINSYTICDGWGKLTLPDSTTYNSLRIKNNTVINADIYLHTLLGWGLVSNRVQTNSSYSWYAPDSKSYIANVGLDTLGNITSFTYKVSWIPKIPLIKFISISPDTAQQGEKLQITLRGKNTYFTKGVFNLYLSAVKIDTFWVMSDTTIIANISIPMASAPGAQFLTYRDHLNSYSYFYELFSIKPSPYAPKLASLSPGYGVKGQITDVIVTGSYTHFTKGANIYFSPVTASPGGIYIMSFTVINDTVLTCKIKIDPATNSTGFDLQFSNSIDGRYVLPKCFSVVTTGINEISDNNFQIDLYPNPNQGKFTVYSNQGIISLEIYDISGKLLFKYEPSTDKNKIEVISNLEDGYYYLKLYSEKSISIKKFIVHQTATLK